MRRILRQLLFALIAFAVVGGTSGQLAPATEHAAPMTMVGMPCDMMMPAASVDHGKPVAPCKDMMPDCSKLTGCVAGIALPTRLVATEFAAQVSAVEYWPAKSERSGLASTPEPNPPRAT